MQKLYLELIQVAIGVREKLSHRPSDEEWVELFEFSKKQAIAGVSFLALDKLSVIGQKPPLNLLFEWIGLSEQIKAANKLLNRRCQEITKIFRDAGYESCILKGQGNARLYPVPGIRTPGDIDIWVFGEREKITAFVKEKCPEAFEQYHHIEFRVFNDVELEVHYTPGALIIPKFNRRFQKWCDSQKSIVCRENGSLGFRVPTMEFNVVYQIAHIMSHFFIEGIGLRHFVDYYYVLRNFFDDGGDISRVVDTFSYLGLEKFASGVMWMEKECLGLEETMLIFEPSEKVGKLIMREMEEGGNFGQYDERYSIRKKGMMARGAADCLRLMRLATVFPAETMWKMWNKVENQKWKIKSL